MPERVLLLSYAFPPVAAAEAYLSAKAVRSLRGMSVDVVSAEPYGPGVGVDNSIDAYTAAAVKRVRRVLHPWWAIPLVLLPPLRRLPDALVWRNRRALAAATELDPPAHDLMLSWSQWHSVHLVALRIKQRHPELPWAARWSDPWVDNPLLRFGPITRHLNRRLERKVVEAADRILFTSERTRDLVMAKYPPAWRAKVCVIPHAFDPELYRTASPAQSERLVLRYLGAFYGARRPEPLFRALAVLHAQDPQLVRRLRVELVGPIPRHMLASAALRRLPAGTVVVRPPVDYRHSLELMRESDLLLVIDAPGSTSVFLPSKLIDYLGAGRRIFGITPPGTAADVIRDAGGEVADPTDPPAIARALRRALCEGEGDGTPASAPEVTARFSAVEVGRQFTDELRDLLRS